MLGSSLKTKFGVPTVVATSIVIGFTGVLSISISALPLRLISGGIIALLLPGYLILGLFDEKFRLGESIIFAVGISIIYSSLFAFLLNLAALNLRNISFSDPYLSYGYLLSILLLLLIYIYWGDYPVSKAPSFNLRPIIHGLVFVVLIITGTHTVLFEDSNILILVALGYGILVMTISAKTIPSKPSQPVLLYLLGLGLLLQMPLSRLYLGGGDSQVEFYTSNLTLLGTVAELSFPSTKIAVFRLSLLHPFHSIFLDINLIQVYKFLQPLIFALIAPSLYYLFNTQFQSETTYRSTILYMSLYPFYAILSMNTRTATALLFVVLFLYTSFRQTQTDKNVILQSVFIAGIIISHYGVAFILLLSLVFVKIGELLLAFFRVENKRLPFSGQIIPLYSIMLLGFYLHSASGYTLILISQVLIDLTTGLSGFFGEESAAGHGVYREVVSSTYTLIRVEFILITLLVGFGSLITSLWAIENYWDRFVLPSLLRPKLRTIPQPSYLLLAVAACGLIAASFAPTSIMGIARVFSISLLILVPFVSITGKSVFQKVFNKHNGLSVWKGVFVTVIALTLIIQTGFMGIVIEERHPQPYLDRDRLDAKEYPQETIHFDGYKQRQSYKTSEWYTSYGSNKKIFGPGYTQRLPTQYFYESIDYSKPPGPYYALTPEVVRKESGLVYISPYTSDSEQVLAELYPSSTNYQQMNWVNLSNYNLHKEDLVYTSGDSKIYNSK